MNCGKGVPLCGVLALESGFGPKNYLHADPVVHGLWPQVPPYGGSKCIEPKEQTVTREKHYCYKDAGKQQLWFENHEWTKHGICAGAVNDDDFFDQVCDLSSWPLSVMNDVRDDTSGAYKRQKSEPEQEKCFLQIISEMKKQFAVYNVDQYNDQILLSACAGNDGRWKLASEADFPKFCGSGSAAPVPAPASSTRKPQASSTRKPQAISTRKPQASSTRKPQAPGPSQQKDVCYPMHSGPKCKSDSDCWDLSGCVRCAKSKKCTDVPKTLRLVEEPASDGAESLTLSGSHVGGQGLLLLAVPAALVSASLVGLGIRAYHRRQVAQMLSASRQVPDAGRLLS